MPWKLFYKTKFKVYIVHNVKVRFSVTVTEKIEKQNFCIIKEIVKIEECNEMSF